MPLTDPKVHISPSNPTPSYIAISCGTPLPAEAADTKPSDGPKYHLDYNGQHSMCHILEGLTVSLAFLTVLEDARLRLRFGHYPISLRPLSLPYIDRSFLPMTFSVPMCFCLLQRTPFQWGHSQVTSFYLQHLCKELSSRWSETLRH